MNPYTTSKLALEVIGQAGAPIYCTNHGTRVGLRVEKNMLYYGDNLYILRNHIKDNSVDLIYLDPPFNSNRIKEAASFGVYESLNGRRYLVIQIVEVEELLNHKKFLHDLVPV